jgi:hypothetical protein
MAKVVERLPSKQKVLSPNPNRRREIFLKIIIIRAKIKEIQIKKKTPKNKQNKKLVL